MISPSSATHGRQLLLWSGCPANGDWASAKLRSNAPCSAFGVCSLPHRFGNIQPAARPGASFVVARCILALWGAILDADSTGGRLDTADAGATGRARRGQVRVRRRFSVGFCGVAFTLVSAGGAELRLLSSDAAGGAGVHAATSTTSTGFSAGMTTVGGVGDAGVGSASLWYRPSARPPIAALVTSASPSMRITCRWGSARFGGACWADGSPDR